MISVHPDIAFLDDINRLYGRIAEILNNDNGMDLETLADGFNVTLEALQDMEQRSIVTSKMCSNAMRIKICHYYSYILIHNYASGDREQRKKLARSLPAGFRFLL